MIFFFFPPSLIIFFHCWTTCVEEERGTFPAPRVLLSPLFALTDSGAESSVASRPPNPRICDLPQKSPPFGKRS